MSPSRVKSKWAVGAVVSVVALGMISCDPETPQAGVTASRRDGLGQGVVISQVYGTNFATGLYNTDYVELFNSGSSGVSVGGWSLQYASAKGTGWGYFSTTSSKVDLPDASIAPGGYYLVALKTTADGNPLPVTPDLSFTTLDLSGSKGKIALVSSGNFLSDAGICPVQWDGGRDEVVDFVGYGAAANCWEGTDAGARMVSGGVVFRKGGGCQDTDSNLNDFESLNSGVVPHNSSSPAFDCSIGADGGGGTGGGTGTGGGAGAGGGEAAGGGTGTGGGMGTGGGAAAGGGTATGGGTGTGGGSAVTCTPIGSAGPFSEVVISQLFGGNGNRSTDPLGADFVELHNISPNPAVMTSYSIQYASAAGSGWNMLPIPQVTLPAGGFYLIQLAVADGGVALPTPDLRDDRPTGAPPNGFINLSSSAGKVALMRHQTIVTTGVTCPPNDALADFVGYGTTANWYETAKAPALSFTTSIMRLDNGCRDTNDNSSDFASQTPVVPRSSQSPAVVCGTGGTGGGSGAGGGSAAGGGSDGAGGGTSRSRTGCGYNMAEPSSFLAFALGALAFRRGRRRQGC